MIPFNFKNFIVNFGTSYSVYVVNLDRGSNKCDPTKPVAPVTRILGINS